MKLVKEMFKGGRFGKYGDANFGRIQCLQVQVVAMNSTVDLRDRNGLLSTNADYLELGLRFCGITGWRGLSAFALTETAVLVILWVRDVM